MQKSLKNNKNFLIFIFLTIVLIIIEILGFSNYLINLFNQYVFNFSYDIRLFSNNLIALYDDIFNRQNLLLENLELKKKIIQYESQIFSSANNNQGNMAYYVQMAYGKARVTGIQNIYSHNAKLKIYFNSYQKNVKLKMQKNDVVILENDILLGFIDEVKGDMAIVKLYYSQDFLSQFNIAVYNLRDKNIKGFISPINNGQVWIRNVSLDSKIYKDDLWLTSNDIFEVPSNLYVGRTKSIVQTGDGFLSVYLELPFDLNNIYEVYLIRA